MVKVINKLEVVNKEGEQTYFLKVEITNDEGNYTYKSLEKYVPFNDFMKTLSMTEEERNIRQKAEDVLKRVLFENMESIMRNEVVEEVDRITKLEQGLANIGT
jgi:hypothetical protein